MVVALVDRMLERWACMWPIVVASECGRYWWTCLAVSSGKESRKPALMALVQVEMTVENCIRAEKERRKCLI